MPTMLYKRRDVVLVLFPNSDLRTAERRPVMVVQAGDLQTALPQVLVAMVSSNPIRAGHPSRVHLSASASVFAETGLLTDSVIMTDNLATIRETEIDRRIGRLSQDSGFDAAMRHTLGL